MNPALPAEAIDFGAAAEKAFGALGGVDAARRAEVAPDARGGAVANALLSLGADELDPRTGLDDAAAAGELCRVAGRCVLPYPVAGWLLRAPDDGRPLALVGGERARTDHGDLFDGWRAAALDGRQWAAEPAGRGLGSRLGPFVTDLRRTGGLGPPAGADVPLHLTLTGWRLLGAAERAVELAVEHVTGRVQFGQPLSTFQAVQFQLADAAVGVDGLRELCRFTLWRVFTGGAGALTDALALRLQSLDVGRAVLRTAQQLHGAAGLCDEYDISVLCRHAQAELRLPFDAERTAAELAAAVDRLGFDGLFPHGGGRR